MKNKLDQMLGKIQNKKTSEKIKEHANGKMQSFYANWFWIIIFFQDIWRYGWKLKIKEKFELSIANDFSFDKITNHDHWF